jgi:alpha-beta hydrolase superfamily lysophospholipase
MYAIPEPPTPNKHKLESPRGAHLATRIWKPTSKPQCLVLFVHGSGWHSGYFDVIAKRLNTAVGAFVAAYDQVSCGYSDMEPGSPKNTMFVHSMDDLVEDMFAALAWAESKLDEVTKEDLPVFLIGESWGAPQVMTAAFYASEQNMKLAGVISLGGAVKVGDSLLPPSIVVNVLCWLARYYPKTAMPGVDTESTFDDAFGDKKWARTARADPKIQFHLSPTLSSVAAMLSSGDYILTNAPKFPCPFLAIHAKFDVRTKMEAMQEFCDKAGATAKLIPVETTGHQLLQDVPTVTNQVMLEVCEWVKLELIKMK